MDVSDNGYGFTSTDLGRNHNLYAASLSGNLASNPTETMTDDSDEKSTGCLRWKLWATEVSDIHGVKHTSGDGSRLRRFLWTLFVLASFGVLVYQCTQAIQNFIEHHHITKLDVTFKELMPFPTVTICNFNKYRRSAVTPSDMVHVGEALGLVDEERNLLYPELFSEEFIYKYKRLNYDMELKKQFNFTEFTLRTSNQKKDTIIECQWNGRECEEEAISHVFTHYGSCYAFNKYHPDTDHYHSKRAGTDNGLRLIINVNTHEHMPTIDLEDSAINVGLKLMIHSRQEPPYVKELGFALGAGSHYFMSLTRKKITRLSQPYGDCEPVVLPTEHYDHYSMSACRIECETELLLKHCGCRLVEQPGDYQVCTAERVHNCAHKTLDEYIEGYLPFECKHTCHTPCESEVYSFTMSTALLKKDIRRSNKAMSNYTLEHIRENVLALTMFFEQLNFETVDQLPETTIIDLLGIIGGNMGLFLGASFLTLLQIVEYLLDECVHCCKRAGRRKSSRNRTKKQRLDDREVHAPLSLPERPRTRMFMNTTV